MPRIPLLSALIPLLAGCHAASTEKPGERLITPTVPTVQATIDVHRHLTDAFDHSNWVFAQVDSFKIRDVAARLSFHDGKVSGGTGCNRLSGVYTRQDTQLRLGEMAMTRMFCADKTEQENRIALALQKVRFAVLVKTDDYLLLLDDRREIIAELKPAPRQD